MDLLSGLFVITEQNEKPNVVILLSLSFINLFLPRQPLLYVEVFHLPLVLYKKVSEIMIYIQMSLTSKFKIHIIGSSLYR